MNYEVEQVGQHIITLPTPSLIVDKAVVRRNCKQMLSICDTLGVTLRAHIKTLKAAECAALMTDAEAPISERDYVSIIVSTTAEAFHVLPMLKKVQKAGKKVSVLYGVPLPGSRIPDLVQVADALGFEAGAVAIMIDHPLQLEMLSMLQNTRFKNFRPSVFIKIDTGYGRAGVPGNAHSTGLKEICEKVKDTQDAGLVKLLGFYSHGGHSYGVNDAPSALSILSDELAGLNTVLPVAESVGLNSLDGGWVLSVGATPSVKAAWLATTQSDQFKNSDAARLIDGFKSKGHTVEFHAGNYPALDLQQLATNAGLSSTATQQADTGVKEQPSGLEDISVSILAEVNSIYTERDAQEGLITAGCLALGREPCKSYSGWGVVSNWPRKQGMSRGSGWYVCAISQEHGRIRKGDVPGIPVDEQERDLVVNERVRIWPNHACIAASNFSRAFVVDSDDKSGGEIIKEIWNRCRGWEVDYGRQ